MVVVCVRERQGPALLGPSSTIPSGSVGGFSKVRGASQSLSPSGSEPEHRQAE
jgi:hypothetical protein